MLVSYSGSEQLTELVVACNQGFDRLFSNVESACKRGLPEIEAYDPVKQPAVIVGGGPSLNSTLENIRHAKQCGARIFALNNSARFLTENGISPDVQVIIDSRQQNVEFLQERWAGEILLASQCHPDLFDQCEKLGYPVRLWHPVIEGIEKHIPKKDPLQIGGGLTVGLSAMCLIYTLGHREMHLYGYDSCHSEDKGHAYSQPMNDTDEITTVTVEGRVFKCSVTMAAQASAFQKVAEMLADLDCNIYVHGDGLIPHIYRQMVKEEKILTAVYDLGVSPPTYDFLGFLVECERARIDGGYTEIDMYFQPGPLHGFRSDNLPPSISERVGMLHRICVSTCRLLPSIRNVHVLKKRQNIKADFPKDYKEDHPISHYGTRYLINPLPCLRATDGARDEVKKRQPRKYATITLRNSLAWGGRNSNYEAWRKAARLLTEAGLGVVWVRDTADVYADAFSWDVDLRMALYEGAVINLGVNNGPTALWYCSTAPYAVFKIVADSGAATKEFLTAHGMNEGDQFSKNGLTVWADDTYENIAPVLTQLLEEKNARI